MMMATGDVHYEYWRKMIVLVGALSTFLYFQGHVIPAIGIFCGYLLGYLIDPDLDHTSDYSAKIRWKRTLVFYPVYLWWKIYSYTIARVFGGHRALLNHLPFVSTGIRLVWVVLPVLVYFGIFGIPAWLVDNAHTVFVIVVSGWIGLSTADLVHYILDYI